MSDREQDQDGVKRTGAAEDELPLESADELSLDDAAATDEDVTDEAVATPGDDRSEDGRDRDAGTEPVEDEPAEEEPAEGEPAEDEPAEEEPVEGEPAEEEPVEEEPAEEELVEEDTVSVDDGSPDWETMGGDSGESDEVGAGVGEFTSEEYLRGTTQEYQGLAEEVERASAAQWEQQAVAASLPGVESGLVGFGDVSGTESESEESFEALEQAATSDLALRIGSAVVIFGLFLGSLLLGGWWFTTFVILLMIVSVGEFFATLRTRGYRPLSLFGLLGVALMGVGAYSVGPMAIAGWAGAATVATILFYSLSPRRNVLANTSVTILGLAWTGMLAFAILIAAGPHPVAHIVFLVIVIASNDVGAYFIGRSFGRRRLAPIVSPNKSVEGFIGGLLFAAIVASVLAVFPPWEEIGVIRSLVTALLIGVFAPIGDLAESMVKRTLDVKDMGSVLPGHGGMLDRIDSFLFCVPVVYILFRGFGLL